MKTASMAGRMRGMMENILAVDKPKAAFVA
jgi:hypothetical protein